MNIKALIFIWILIALVLASAVPAQAGPSAVDLCVKRHRLLSEQLAAELQPERSRIAREVAAGMSPYLIRFPPGWHNRAAKATRVAENCLKLMDEEDAKNGITRSK